MLLVCAKLFYLLVFVTTQVASQYVASQYRSVPQYQAAQPQYQPAAPQYQVAERSIQYASVPATQYQQVAPQYQAAPQYQPAPQYQGAPQYANTAPAQASYSPVLQQALDRGDYIGDGDYHGEGLSEAQASELDSAPSVPQYSQPAGAPISVSQYQTTAPQPQYQQSVAAAVVPQSHGINRGPQVFNTVPSAAAVAQYTASTTYGGANGGPSAYSTAAAPSALPQQFPAGLDPRACPNYPFCHS